MVTSRLLWLLIGSMLMMALVTPVMSQDDDAVDDVVDDDDVIDDAGDDDGDDDDDDEFTMPPLATATPPTTTESNGEEVAGGIMEDVVDALAQWEKQHMEPNSEYADIVYKLLDEIEKTDPDVAAQMREEIKDDQAVLTGTGEEKHRKKRMVLADDKRKYTGGIVPYEFTAAIDPGQQFQIKRAMAAYERLTCFRFPEWTGNNKELGVDHAGYMKFVSGGGCWSQLGRSFHAGAISCCGGSVCLHEMGHGLGAYHENTDPRAKPFVRMNLQNVKPDKLHNFGYKSYREFSTGYHSESLMHYDTWAFSKNGKDTVSVMDKDIRISRSPYYLFQELSLSHKCGETYCSGGPDCVNDGYKTWVDGYCGCVCPYGLDPKTGCATTITDDNTWLDKAAWPKGKYALPRAQSGCVAGMKEGSKVMPGGGAAPCEDTDKRGCPYWGYKGCLNNAAFMNPRCPKTCKRCKYLGSHSSEKFDLVSAVPGDQSKVETGFCVNDGSVGKSEKRDDGIPFKWPMGHYCIYQVGGSCPEGFTQGSVTFQHGKGASDSGALPDVESNGDSTTYKFCCRGDMLIEYPTFMPVDQPFALISYKEPDRTCPIVAGMNRYVEWQKIRATSVKKDGGMPDIRESEGLYRIAYCYYVPTKKSCGGVIELTADNPTATIEGNSGPEQECHWLIKPPTEKDRIRLNIESINMPKADDGRCADSLGVRSNRIGFLPKLYCGTKTGPSIISVFDRMMVTYSTKDKDRGSSFKATISLIQESDLCYNAADNGASYAGTVNVTRDNVACVPWASTMKCRHNLFQHGDHVDNLESNYCRNPDAEDGRAPWCYTNEETCDRSYCDVCQLERKYDRSGDCDLIKSLGVCANKPQQAASLCADTCAENTPQYPAPVKIGDLAGCSKPSAPTDGQAVDAGKGSYKVGDQVAFACKDDASMVYSKRCLTDGTWSSLEFVCTECPNGWWAKDGQCFNFYPKRSKKSEAQAACEGMGAKLAVITSKAQNDLVARIGPGSWLGGSDSAAEGSWVWDDGKAFGDFTNWRKGEPDNWYKQQDCVAINSGGEWIDEHCDRDKHPYTCMKPARSADDASVCTDFNSFCMDNYISDPRMCGRVKENDVCKQTCGLCKSGKCKVEKAPKNAVLVSGGKSIDVGGYAEYKCEDGAEMVGGNARRGCKIDGSMTGAPLKCKKEKLTTTFVKTLAGAKQWGGKYKGGYAVTGAIPEFKIPKSGKITQWRFYSMRAGKGALQVWRCKGKNCQLIGSNPLTTPATGDTYTYYVAPKDQIKVKKGDLIGIFMGPEETPFGVGWTLCDASSNKKDYKGKLLRSKKPVKGKGKEKFKPEKQPCRNYHLQAVIE